MADSHRLLALLYDCANDLGSLSYGKKVDRIHAATLPGGETSAIDAYFDLLERWFLCITAERNKPAYALVKKRCESIHSLIGKLRARVEEVSEGNNKTIGRSAIGPLKSSITGLKKDVRETRMPLSECLDLLNQKGAAASYLGF